MSKAAASPVAIDTAGNVDRSVYAGNRFEEVNGKCIDLDGFHHGEVLDNACINRGSADDYPHGHYGIVFNNSNPDMQSEEVTVARNVIDGAKFGGIFVLGSRNRILGNVLRNLNLAHCNDSGAKYGCLYYSTEPDLLRSGIYLGSHAARPAPARGNLYNPIRFPATGCESAASWPRPASPWPEIRLSTTAVAARGAGSHVRRYRQDALGLEPPRA